MTSQILHAAASAAINEALVAGHLLSGAHLRLATAQASWMESLANCGLMWATAAGFARRGKTAAAAAARASARNLDKAHERTEADVATATSVVEFFSAVAAAFEAQLWWGWPVPEVGEGEQGGLELVTTGQEEQPGMGFVVGTAEGGVSAVGGNVYGQGEWAFVQPAPAEAVPSAADRARDAFREKVHEVAAARSAAPVGASSSSARSVPFSRLAYTGRDWPAGYASSTRPSSPSSSVAALRKVEEKRRTFYEKVQQAAEASKPPPPPTVEWWEVADGDDYWTDDEIFIPNILPRRATDGVPCRPTTWGPKKDVPASKRTPPCKSWLVRDTRGR